MVISERLETDLLSSETEEEKGKKSPKNTVAMPDVARCAYVLSIPHSIFRRLHWLTAARRYIGSPMGTNVDREYYSGLRFIHFSSP